MWKLWYPISDSFGDDTVTELFFSPWTITSVINFTWWMIGPLVWLIYLLIWIADDGKLMENLYILKVTE